MAQPFLKIRPPGGWFDLRLREVVQYRELLWVLGVRDVTVRYRQTVLGALWIVLGPIVSAGVFSFVFGRVAGLPTDGIPYFAFSYAGLLAWNVFNTTLGKTSSCLVANSTLISKVYFPRLVLPLSTIFGTLVNFGIGLVIMAGMIVHYGLGFRLEMLLLPVWILLMLMLSLGVGFVLAAVMVLYRDVQYITGLLTSLLLYISPIAYATDAVPERYEKLYLLNPLAGLLEGFRHAMFGTGNLPELGVAYAIAFTFGVFVVGALAFSKMEPKFSDVI